MVLLLNQQKNIRVLFLEKNKTKLNKNKDELFKLLSPFEEEIKTVEKDEKDVQVEKEEEDKYEYGMKLQFIDSFSFLSTSLEKLVKNSAEFPILRQEFPQYKDEDLKLLKRKGVFPYSWLDDPSKSCCKEDCEHAQEVWKHFNCKTFKD